MNPTLSDLQQRLTTLQNQLNVMPLSSSINQTQQPIVQLQPLVQQPIQQPMIQQKYDREELKGIIKEILVELNTSGNQDSFSQKELTLQDAICQALSKEDEAWLCTEEKILNIPHFFITTEGKEIINLFVQSYKEHYANRS